MPRLALVPALSVTCLTGNQCLSLLKCLLLEEQQHPGLLRCPPASAASALHPPMISGLARRWQLPKTLC